MLMAKLFIGNLLILKQQIYHKGTDTFNRQPQYVD